MELYKERQKKICRCDGTMSGKIICPKCNGNGFVYAFNHDDRKKHPVDCDYCKNQGEVDITEDVIKDLDDAGQLQ